MTQQCCGCDAKAMGHLVGIQIAGPLAHLQTLLWRSVCCLSLMDCGAIDLVLQYCLQTTPGCNGPFMHNMLRAFP